MARIRSLKPEIWMSAQVMNLSKPARLLFIGLITQADDEGRGSADARRIKAAIFGGDDDTAESVRRWLDEIVEQGLITIYHAEKHGDLYALRSWRHHQKIDKPKPSGYPQPPDPVPVVDTSSTSRRGSEGSDRIGSSGSDGSYGGDSTITRTPGGESEPAEGNGDPGQQSTAGFSDEAEHAEWLTVAELYPPGAARVDWIGAEHAARNLVGNGLSTWPQLRDGVSRYAKHCEATNRMVLNPVKFFTDRDKPWSQAWPIPAGKTDPNREELLARLKRAGASS